MRIGVCFKKKFYHTLYMDNLEAAKGFLLGLAQIALAVVAADAVLQAYFDLGFLEGLVRDITYFGGLVGLIDQLYWLFTSRIPKLLE